MLVSISISDHLVRTASPGRTHVRSCHSISSLVSKRIEALFRATRKRGSSEGGNAGIFCFFWLAEPLPQVVSRIEFYEFFCCCIAENFIQAGYDAAKCFKDTSFFYGV